MIRYKNGVKAVTFCTVAVILFSCTYKVFSWKDTGGGYLSSMKTFYGLERDVVDVLFLGSSHCYCSINPAVLWEKYGIAAFSLSISGQDLASSYHCMKEALKTQQPRVVCVEMYYTNFHGYQIKGNMYRNLLGYQISQNFADAVGDIAEAEEVRELLLKWPIIHTRYAELTEKDFRQDEMMRTYIGHAGGFYGENIGEISVYQGEEQIAIGEEEEIWLERIFDLAEEKGVELCFFLAPFGADEETQMRYRYVESLAEAHQVPFLNLIALHQELGLDVEQDFTDTGHTNSYGALKVSDHLGGYLSERYELQDRRGDERYRLWEENLLIWNHQMQNRSLQQTADLGAYLDAVKMYRDDYIYIVFSQGEYLAEAEDLADRLEGVGIGEEFFDREGVWVIEDGTVLYQTVGEDCFRHMRIGGSDLLINRDGDELQIVIDRQEYGKASQGIDIIVYDKALGQIVDEVGFQALREYICVR